MAYLFLIALPFCLNETKRISDLFGSFLNSIKTGTFIYASADRQASVA